MDKKTRDFTAYIIITEIKRWFKINRGCTIDCKKYDL